MLTLTRRLTHHTIAIGGLILASHLALAQNWVPSGPPGAPVVPFDVVVDGWTAPAGPGLPKLPLYTCRGGRSEGYGLQVGKFTPGSTGCEFGYGGLEITVPDFEFLVTSWQAASFGAVPPNAVQGGWDPISPTTKLPLYYCRGKIGGGPQPRPPVMPVSLQLGKIRPGFQGCVVPYSGSELTLGNYEVLVSLDPPMPLAVVSAINGFVPQDAIHAGTDADGTPLYICSAIFGAGNYPGKLHSSFGGCNISVAGVEHTVSNYFVLRPDWLGIPDYSFPAGVDVSGVPEHVCRAYSGGGLYPGKTRTDWKTCNFGLSGKEETSTTYEILSH
ncbi:MAG TPA: DM9 repeat-containing protein [Bryobacteraceae bacterium]|nr:DM9 repeat-containing protein [Bryobacteraceae bacterium]